MLQRNIFTHITLRAVLIMQHRVAVRERAAARVLARNPDGVAFREKRREGEVLSHAPVHRSRAFRHLAAAVEHADHERMQPERRRHRGNRAPQLSQLRDRNARRGFRPCLPDPGAPVHHVLRAE